MRKWLWPILGLIGVILFVFLSPIAQPEAQVDLNVTREESVAIARDYLTQHGFDLTGYDHAVAFAADENTLVYLQRTHSLADSNALSREYKIWRWSVRWFKPDQQTEYQVAVDTAQPRVIGFGRVNYPETEQGARLSEADARRKAEALLTQQGYALADWDLVGSRSKEEPNRTDYHFEWQHKTVTVSEAYPKIDVDVEGDVASSLTAYLLIPDAFQREYEKTTSAGTAMATASQGIMLVMWLVAAVMAIVLARRAAWQMGLWGGILMVVLSLGGTVNSLSLAMNSYPTTMPLALFYVITIVGGLMSAIGNGAGILFPGASGQGLLVQMERDGAPYFSQVRSRLLTPGFAASAARGLSVAGIMLGFMSVFYFVGREYLGVWSPAGPRYSDILATPAPWLYPLLISVMAAFGEEYTFRLFGVALAKRLVRWTPLALLIPSVIWAFAHSNYPVFPVWTRGVELTIVGTFLAWVFWRYDIETTIIAHYTYDALLVGWPLLLSGNAYYVASGAVVTGLALIPALIGLVAYRRSPVADSPVPQPDDQQPSDTAPAPARTVQDFGGAWLDRLLGAIRTRPAPWLLAGLACILAAVLLAPVIHPSAVREYGVSEARAEAIGREYLAAQGFDLTDMRVARKMGTEKFLDYVTDVAPDQADAFRRDYSGVNWELRFFKPLNPVSYRVSVDIRTGRVSSFIRELPRDAAGAKLESGRARQIAEEFMKAQGVDLSSLTLADSADISHDDRRDYHFVWESTDPRLPDSRIQREVTVQGDQVGDYWGAHLYVPEAWTREQQSHTWRLVTAGLLVVLVGLAGIVMAIIYLVKRQASWKSTGLIALLSALLFAPSLLAAWPAMAMSYDTNMIWIAFVVIQAIGLVLVPPLMGFGVGALWAVGSVVGRDQPEPMRLDHAALAGLATAGLAAGASLLLSLPGGAKGVAAVPDITGGYLALLTLFAIPVTAVLNELVMRLWFQSLAARALRSRLAGAVAAAVLGGLFVGVMASGSGTLDLGAALAGFVADGLIFGLAYLVGGLPVVLIGQASLMLLQSGTGMLGATLAPVAVHGYLALMLSLLLPVAIWLWARRRRT